MFRAYIKCAYLTRCKMIRQYLKYKKMLDSGEYETLDELRNALGLDYLDVFEHIDTPDNDNTALKDSSDKK